MRNVLVLLFLGFLMNGPRVLGAVAPVPTIQFIHTPDHTDSTGCKLVQHFEARINLPRLGNSRLSTPVQALVHQLACTLLPKLIVLHHDEFTLELFRHHTLPLFSRGPVSVEFQVVLC